MTQNTTFDYQTNLDISEAEKKDLEDEVKHLKESIKSKNQEIGVLRSKLRSSETRMTELQNFLMSQVSALTAKLSHPLTPEPQPTLENDNIPISIHLSDQDTNQEPPPALPSLPTSSTQLSQVTPAPDHPVPSSPCKEKTGAVTKRVVREEGDAFHVLTENSEEVFKNPLFMEMISFTLRSTSASLEGVSLNMKIDIPASHSVREVLARFSKKLLVPMDRLVMRFNGRELSAEEEVRALANQTVWLSVIGVKEESI